MAQKTQTGALCQPRGVEWGGRWEGASKGRGYMYTCGRFVLRFERKQQKSVKQLSFNKKINYSKNQKWNEVNSLTWVWLWPMDCSLPDSSVHGVFQAKVLEWVAISFARGSSPPRDRTWVSGFADRCFTVWTTREAPQKEKHAFNKEHVSQSHRGRVV